jgi:hypothetical protein
MALPNGELEVETNQPKLRFAEGETIRSKAIPHSRNCKEFHGFG